MNALKNILWKFVIYLTKPNPIERRRNIWFQVEAKAERSSNVIRTVYVLVWVLSTSIHAPGNPFWSNIANLGCGGFWLVWCIGYQFYLTKRPYNQRFKYMSTTVDMAVITATIFLYQFTAGPAYALKVPTFLNYFCCMGLAALRYRLHLAIYAGVAAAVSYTSLCVYFILRYPVELGTGVEHTTSAKLNLSYVFFNGQYMIVFTFLIYFLVYNVKRLVNLRIREGENALKAKERAVIAANVAHEIKNPLEGIYGAAQLLKEEGKGNPKFLDMILKDSIRLNGVIQQFLQFSRPFLTRPADFDAVDAVRAFCRQQTNLAGDQVLNFHADCERAFVHSDPEGLEQILLNLFQNARRYQPAGKPVGLRVRGRNAAVEVAVEDDGEGITPENQKKIFDPFFTTSTKGTGLGLAISRKVAREMGGDLYFEPKQPGARFILILKTGNTVESRA